MGSLKWWSRMSPWGVVNACKTVMRRSRSPNYDLYQFNSNTVSCTKCTKGFTKSKATLEGTSAASTRRAASSDLIASSTIAGHWSRTNPVALCTVSAEKYLWQSYSFWPVIALLARLHSIRYNLWHLGLLLPLFGKRTLLCATGN